MPYLTLQVVFQTPDFLRYFHEVTPEGELANMNIGSRPSHRKKSTRTVGSIRAIPWIFAWTQVRSSPHHLTRLFGTLRLSITVASPLHQPRH